MNKAQEKKFRDLLDAKRREIIKRAQQTLDEDMTLDANELPDEMDLASSEYLQSFTFRLRGREKVFLEKIQKAGVKHVTVDRSLLDGAVLLEDVVNMNTGEVLLEANDAFVQTHLEMFLANNVQDFTVCFPELDPTGKVFSETLSKDHTEDSEEAAKELFKKIRPGEPATLESSKKLLYSKPGETIYQVTEPESRK